MTQFISAYGFWILLGLILVTDALLIVLMKKKIDMNDVTQRIEESDRREETGRQNIVDTVKLLGDKDGDAIKQLGESVRGTLQHMSEMQEQRLESVGSSLEARLSAMKDTIAQMQSAMEKQLEGFRDTLEESRKSTADAQAALRDSLTRQQQEFKDSTEKKLELQLGNMQDALRQMQNALGKQMVDFRLTLADGQKQSIDSQSAMQESLARQQREARENTDKVLQENAQKMEQSMSRVESRIQSLEESNERKLDAMRRNMTEGMESMRQENARKLDEIRGTVDEKLQSTLEKRISESFKAVSEQLEQVYKSIGEMQTLAHDVGGLKKVLSGVKTRGILGEVRLGAILSEILNSEQYDTNVATIPGSTERVEFAVKLPGGDGRPVYLPIDSKFPGDTYARLVDAQQNGDKALVDQAYKELESVLRSEAKDIRTKYVETPYTTNFGILFLPFEGLYAEVVSHGMLEKLQRDYQVNVAGPSTMAALLNSLQMGFQTLAIQKRSSEVWELLGAVKTQFDKFEDSLKKMQGHLNQTSSDLETLIGTRTRMIKSKLRSVQTLDEVKAEQLLTGEVAGEENE